MAAMLRSALSSRQLQLDGVLPVMETITSERHLAALAHSLGAEHVRGWSPAESALVSDLPNVSRSILREVRQRIESGRDPLGEQLLKLRSSEIRRPHGATYTPFAIVRTMLRWSGNGGKYSRVVDPGAGSGRFLIAAGRHFTKPSLIGIELDPLAALLARASLNVAGHARRAEIVVADYREWLCTNESGRTLFIGNPPYVRHHLVSAEWKTWLRETAERRKLDASQLAGLHIHFFLATLERARPGDVGAFITAAEWLDVNYGRLLRQMFLGDLGGKSVTLLEPTVRAFADAATTAAITCFEVGARPRSIRLRRVASLEDLGSDAEGGRVLRRERLEAAARWTPLTRIQKKTPDGYVELGELCRVHRGQVTGKNSVWIAGPHSSGLPRSVLFSTVTRARELIKAAGVLRDRRPLRNVIDLPADLDSLPRAARYAVEAFLRVAKQMGADRGYVAESRKSWWSVGLREPAPILSTYMARRSPAFVRNLVDARHINIAHGLYPREPMEVDVLDNLAAYLAASVSTADGRTYSGGLTKFEPREMERIPVPDLALLGEATAMIAP